MAHTHQVNLPASKMPGAIPDVARRAAVALAIRVAQGTGLRWRIKEASLRIALGQDATRGPHVAIVLERIALVVITPANSAAIWLRHSAQLGPIEIILIDVVVPAANSCLNSPLSTASAVPTDVTSSRTSALGFLTDWVPFGEIPYLTALAARGCASVSTAIPMTGKFVSDSVGAALVIGCFAKPTAARIRTATALMPNSIRIDELPILPEDITRSTTTNATVGGRTPALSLFADWVPLGEIA